MNLTRILWRHTGRAKVNFVRQGFQKLLSDRHTDRQTDALKIIYHATSKVVKNSHS